MKGVACAAVVALGAGSIAPAASINLDYRGWHLAQSVRVVDGSLGFDRVVPAGVLRFDVIAGGSNAPIPTGRTLYLYCMDLAQGAGDGLMDIVPLSAGPLPGPAMGEERARLLRNLYATCLADSMTSAQKAAGFALAVWEIINETSIDVSAINRLGAGLDAAIGDFRAATNGGARNRANEYLEDAFAAFRSGSAGKPLAAAVNPRVQDVIIPTIPLPTPGGLAAVALGLIMVPRRRR